VHDTAFRLLMSVLGMATVVQLVPSQTSVYDSAVSPATATHALGDEQDTPDELGSKPPTGSGGCCSVHVIAAGAVPASKNSAAAAPGMTPSRIARAGQRDHVPS
jgi:hypothetical protein